MLSLLLDVNDSLYEYVSIRLCTSSVQNLSVHGIFRLRGNASISKPSKRRIQLTFLKFFEDRNGFTFMKTFLVCSILLLISKSGSNFNIRSMMLILFFFAYSNNVQRTVYTFEAFVWYRWLWYPFHSSIYCIYFQSTKLFCC